jgi:hypothetical protein
MLGVCSWQAAAGDNRMSWFSVKWKVPVPSKLLNSAAARREFFRHGGLSFD